MDPSLFPSLFRIFSCLLTKNGESLNVSTHKIQTKRSGRPSFMFLSFLSPHARRTSGLSTSSTVSSRVSSSRRQGMERQTPIYTRFITKLLGTTTSSTKERGQRLETTAKAKSSSTIKRTGNPAEAAAAVQVRAKAISSNRRQAMPVTWTGMAYESMPQRRRR